MNARALALKGAGNSAEVVAVRAKYLANLNALDNFAYQEQLC